MMPESPPEDRRTSSPRCQLLLEIVLPSCFTQGHVLLRGGSPRPVTTDSKSKCLSFWLSRRIVLKGPPERHPRGLVETPSQPSLSSAQFRILSPPFPRVEPKCALRTNLSLRCCCCWGPRQRCSRGQLLGHSRWGPRRQLRLASIQGMLALNVHWLFLRSESSNIYWGF